MRPLLLGLESFPDHAGGANRYVHDLLEHSRAVGLGARGVVLGRSEPADGDVVVAARPDDPLVRRLVRFKAAAERAGEAADLVDVHFALYAFLPVVCGRLRRKPLVVHFHGPWADESAAAGDASRIGVAAKRLVERIVYGRAAAAVTLSGAFKRILVERYGVLPWLVEVLPPGVDCERFRPGDCDATRADLGVEPHTQIVLTVRRLIPRTGVDVLLQAFARLDCDALLLVAGEGPERERLERLAHELGVADSVRFLGGVSEERLVALYSAADLTVVPSVSLEGFGLVVLESLACGTPVIASDAGGLPEALAGLEPRCVVPAGDPAALAERLTRPLPQPKACRARAERFSWERSLERHAELYRRTVDGPRRDRLRVVYLDHTARLSGAELALLRTLQALDGVDAHVILAEDGPLVERLLEAGVSVEVQPLGRRALEVRRDAVGGSLLASREAARVAAYSLRLARRLRHLRPDIVHTNSLKAAFYGGLAGRIAGVPVISHIHDRIAEDYLPSSAAQLTRRVLGYFPRAVVVPSNTVAETVGRPAAVIPWGTPTPAVRGSRNPARPLTVGIVGRVAPWKGQHVFIDAFARAFPDGDARAVVVGAPLFGADEERYLADLHGLAGRRGLSGRVRFTGFVDDVAAELADLDVLVHASVVPEPFGQVVLEGMAAGLPVVAASPGGPAELISDGEDGLLYEAGDADALAGALHTVAHDTALRLRLGAAAQRRSRDFGLGQVADRVRKLYDEVLETDAGGV
jgi:glycosyltransferase involved in cell wall biosynthesis